MIARVRRGEIGKTTTTPVKIIAIDNHATDAGTMPAQELGGAMYDDIGTPLKGATEIGRGKGIVNHQRNVVGLCNRRDFCKGEDGNVWIAQSFTKENLGVGANCFLKIAGVTGVDKGHFNAKLWQCIVKLVKGSPIKPTAADNVIPRIAQRDNGHKLCGMPTAGSQACNAPFKVGDALFQYIRGRIHNPSIDVAQFAQRKEISCMFCIAELIAGGLINGDGATTCGWISGLTCVKLAGGKAKGAFGTHIPSFPFRN